MSRYQHTKGQIKDNAIEALLHDPLFRQRVEKNKKGKGSYLRKEKHGKGYGREASDALIYHWLSAFCGLIKNGCSVLSAGHEFQTAGLLLWLVQEQQLAPPSYG